MDDVAPVAAAAVPTEPTEAVRDGLAEHTPPPEAAATATPVGITPEVVAVIQKAAAELVGRQVRILSVKVVSEPRADSSSWAGQGRDIIQTSHNIVQRGH